MEYKSLKEFKESHPIEYGYLFRRKLIDKLCQDMNWVNTKFIPWTFQRCLTEALKYKTKSEWIKNGKYSYGSAVKHSWYDECIAHMKKNKK